MIFVFLQKNIDILLLNMFGGQMLILVKIKRCGEMARKLRFFKEQMFKAGVSPKGSTTQSDVNIDDIEVCKYIYWYGCFPLLVYFVSWHIVCL